MENLNRLILLIALYIPLFSQVFAAQADSSSLEFTCITWGEFPVEELYYKDGKSYEPIKFRNGKRSQGHSLKEAEVFELYVPEVNDVGKSYYKLVGAKPLVTQSQQLLFIIMPAEVQSRLPLRIISLDDSLEGFPLGSFQFANYTDSGLRIKVRDEVTELESGQTGVAYAQSTEDEGMVPVTFTTFGGELLHFTRFYAHARSRELILIRKPKSSRKALEFKFIPQNVPMSE